MSSLLLFFIFYFHYFHYTYHNTLSSDNLNHNIFSKKHIKTPKNVKAVYVSQCAATNKRFRTYFEKLLKTTEINALVIDVKDYTGTVIFRDYGKGCKTNTLEKWIDKLHKIGVYTIARITVFQDPYYTQLHPESAVHKRSATTTPWKDWKGLSFVDVGDKNFRKYILKIAQDSYNKIGFDELNFDYIRYPSDGPMKDVFYSISGDENGNVKSKSDELEDFFIYLHKHLKKNIKGDKPKLSADLFGMTTTNFNDLFIGQIQEKAEPYFDYLCPMVYPSHYPKWFLGFENPNENVYSVVNYSLKKAVERLSATSTRIKTRKFFHPVSTSTPNLYIKPSSDSQKLRPWLQDFNYGGNYDANKVRAQIQAVYDAGLSSWMLWDSANSYTLDALKKTKTGKNNNL